MLFSGSLNEYFFRVDPWLYVVNNSALIISYWIPGSFEGLRQNGVVNGSLWTLPYEVAAYTILLVAFSAGCIDKKIKAVGLFSLILFISMLQPAGFLVFDEAAMERTMLPLCFSAGSLACLLKEKININISILALIIATYLFSINSAAEPYMMYASIFYAILYISTRKPLLKIKPKSDISYGIYLWGWPLQQVTAHYIPDASIMNHVIIASAASIFAGYLSWILVEKRFIQIGKAIIKNSNKKTEEPY